METDIMMEREVGVLPDGWEWKKIGDLCKRTVNVNPLEEPETVFTYLDIGSINNKLFCVDEPKRITGKDAPSRARKSVTKGDILFATTRPNLKNIAIVEEEYEKPVASTGFCILSPTSKVDSRYLFYFLITEFVQEQIQPMIRGAQYPAIADKDLLSIEIPIPPLAEQNRIVQKLDALFARIDEAIALTEEAIERIQSLLPAALNEVFPASSNYLTVSLVKHVEFVGGSQPPKDDFLFQEGEGLVRLIQIRDYKSDSHKVFIRRDSTKKFCEVDDIMIGRYGPPVFQILRGLQGAYNVALMKAVPDERFILKDYLFWFLQNPTIQDYIIGTSQRSAGQSGVNKGALEKYEIPLPSLNAQQGIVSNLKAVNALIRKMGDAFQEKAQQLNNLKTSLQEAAFNGLLI